MRHSKRMMFGAVVVLVSLQASRAFAVNAIRRSSFKRCLSEALEQERVDATGLRAYYLPILSSDLDFLRDEARFAEGPAPQKNIAVIGAKGQFRFNGETKAILELKKRLMSRFRDRIIDVQKGHATDILNAVREQFGMMLNELPEAAPHVFRREGDALVNLLTGDRLSAADLQSTRDSRSALEKLGRMVPDDLVFMKKRGDEYHLIGGNLAFPTHWSINDALGDSISEIHGSLSDDPEKVKAFSSMINRVLDRTLASPDVVRRNNWFLELDPRYPLPDYLTVDYRSPGRIGERNYRDSVFVRSERQTLRGLPQSRVVVFAIQPMVFPVESILKDRTLAANLLEGIKVKLLPDRDNPGYVSRVAKSLERDLARDSINANTAKGPSFTAIRAKVISGERINDSSYLIRVEKPPGFALVPGEAVRVTLDTPNGKVSRTLSLSSSPSHGYLEFAVRDSESDFKKAFRSLNAGDQVGLELTKGSLDFKPEQPAVMIAGGIGITPFRSFIQYVKEKNLKTPMWLFYGNRSQIAFEDEINKTAASNARLNVTHVLSKADPEWQGARGRIDEAFLLKAVPTLPENAIYYVVGSPQMVNDTRQALLRMNVPESRISVEAFPGYESRDASSTDPSARSTEGELSGFSDQRTVCYCYNVSAGVLREAIRNGAGNLAEIQDRTHATTGCGGCQCNVMGLLRCEMTKLGR